MLGTAPLHRGEVRVGVPVLLGVGMMIVGGGLGLALAVYVTTLLRSPAHVSPVTTFAYALLLTIGLQWFHLIEHIAQVIQAFVLNSSQPHGLIGQLDLEQVHFAFNTLYLGLLAYIMLRWLPLREELSKRWGLFAVILALTLLAQGYHEVEHSVELAQFLRTNVQGTPGILGSHFNGIIVHFVINAVVFIPVVVVFFGAGLHKRLALASVQSPFRMTVGRGASS